MKKLYILLVGFCLFFLNSNGQEVWSWATSSGGDTTDYAYEVATDLNGNVFVTGSFLSDTMIVGIDTLISKGDLDVFLVRYDSDGNIIWGRSFGGSNVDNGISNATDQDGNIYVTGFFMDTIFFGSDTLASSGDFDVFLVKFDPNGNKLWGVKGGGASVDKCAEIYIDRTGHLYMNGRFYSASATYGGQVITNTSAGSDDIFVIKYDLSGNVIWAKSVGGSTHDQSYGITADIFGNVYVTGWYYSSSINFGATTINNNGFIDFYLLKFDSSGNPIWAKSAGSNLEDEGFGVTTDSLGFIYVTGNFHSASITFDAVTLSSHGDRDMFVCKYDSLGNVVWAKNVGGSLQDRGENIDIDTLGNVIVAGWFYSTNMIVAGETLLHSGGNDLFVAKFDTSGNEIWGKSAGGSLDELSNSIALDVSGNIYVCGYSTSTDLTFGTNAVNNNGFRDYFLAKISECSLSIDLNGDISICQGDTFLLNPGSDYSYLWSTGDTNQTISVDTAGIFWVEVTDLNNCIATDTVNIALNNLPVFDIGNDTTLCSYDTIGLSADSIFGSYLWSTGDTNQMISVNTTGTYWVEATDSNNCVNADTIIVSVNQQPTFSIGSDTTLCSDFNIVLVPDNAYESYLWSDNSNNDSLYVDSTGLGIGSEIIWLQVTDSNGCLAADSIIITFDNCGGLASNYPGGIITVYPNPARDFINLKLESNNTEATRIEIVDINGKVLFNKGSLKSIVRINISDFPTGIYFIIMTSGDFEIQKSIIKY